MINKEVLEILKEEERYKDFIILEKELPFCELFKNEDYDPVQVHCANIFKTNDNKRHIIGFCGVFAWQNNQLQSSNGDSYNPDMKIFGYEKFDYEDGIAKNGLDILVGNDW